jgi:predicted N-acyltransferase
VSATLTYWCCSEIEQQSIRDFQLSVFHSIENISELQWNNHVPATNVLMQYNSLKLLEHVQGNDMQFCYVFAQRDDKVVGVMYFQTVTFKANQLINYFPEGKNGFLWNTAKSLTEKILNLINVKLLVSGNVFMTGENGFYFLPEVDKATRAKILRQTVRQIANENSLVKATLVSDLYEPKTEFDSAFKKNGYHEITVESDMSIQLNADWKTFDDYISAFSSKYRVRAKKVFALCNANHVEMKNLSEEEVETHKERLHELYLKVMHNADFKLADLNEIFFVAFKKNLGNSYRIHAYFKGGDMIGFISAFHFGKKMEVHYTGMDHEKCKPIHLYQHMMYDMVKYGIENKAERLHFGRTAPEIKSTIGALPSPMYGYVKHFNPLINFLLVRTYTANLKPKKYIFRNPFKE